mmetsp:Transcript_63675/g.175732  ORF Transcript_63675/g.175732 Transcript_63675/m.175732 type:complete len:127 (-) Transcript_63675:2962-3342(-)
MVLHNEDIDDETKNALKVFAMDNRDDVVVLTVDIRLEPHSTAIAESILKLAGVSWEEAKFDGKMDRPFAVILGETGSLVFDGFYQREPIEWFWNDWKEQGSGGSSGKWVDAKKKKKRKSRKGKKEL